MPPSVPRSVIILFRQRNTRTTVSPDNAEAPTTSPLLFTPLAALNVPPKVPKSIIV